MIYLFNRDPDFPNFEINYFLMGTDFAGEDENKIQLMKMRLPKLIHG